MVPPWYRNCVSVLTVKNLDEGVLARLAERAAAEGRSVQELARECLTRAADVPTLHEQLAARRAERWPMSWEQFEKFRQRPRRAS